MTDLVKMTALIERKASPVTLTVPPTSTELLAECAAAVGEFPIVGVLTIDSEDTLQSATDLAARFGRTIDAIEAERTERVKPLNDEVRSINGAYKSAIECVAGPFEALKMKLLGYHQEQQRKREAAEAAERARRAQADREAREAADKAEREAKEALQRANEQAAAGDLEAAAATQQAALTAVEVTRAAASEAAAVVHAPVRMSGGAKVSGVRGTWKARTTDKALMLAHIGAMCAAGDDSLANLFDVNDTQLNALARMREANLNLPGAESYLDTSVNVRRRA